MMEDSKSRNSEELGKRFEIKEDFFSENDFQANSQLETTRKNAEKRSGLAELAEKSANERIEEIKREQWALVEQIRSEKRETDAQLQKETENCSRLRNELEMAKERFKIVITRFFFFDAEIKDEYFELLKG